MKEIILNNKVIGYLTKYTPKTKKEELINFINQKIEELKDNVKNDAFDLTLQDEKVKDILEFGLEVCSKLCKKESLIHNDILGDFWINRVKAFNPIQWKTTEKDYKIVTLENAVYHDHVSLHDINEKFKPNYTFVYYVQLPNNIEGLEGTLLLKDEYDNVYTYYPKEGDFLIIPANLEHAPMASPNSTIDRLVVAGSVGFYKKEKTLI